MFEKEKIKVGALAAEVGASVDWFENHPLGFILYLKADAGQYLELIKQVEAQGMRPDLERVEQGYYQTLIEV